MKKTFLLMIGFMAGVVYVVACGSESDPLVGVTRSIAQTVINAIDVVYNNATSRLAAANVQDAIDELARRDSALTPTQLAGTWNGKFSYFDPTNATSTTDSAHNDDISFVFDAGGTYTVTIAGSTPRTNSLFQNASGASWILYGKTLFLKRDGAAPNYTQALWYVAENIEGKHIELIAEGPAASLAVLVLDKAP